MARRSAVSFQSSVDGYPHGYRVTAVVHGLQFSVLSFQFPTRFSVSDSLQSPNSVKNPKKRPATRMFSRRGPGLAAPTAPDFTASAYFQALSSRI